MIKPSEFGRILFAEPFVPFRIHMASGCTFDVWHPEFVSIGKSSFALYTTSEDDPDGPEWEERISLMLCELLSPLDPAINAKNTFPH
jgi:hypothetical protein